jgi:hypothetical protein
MAGAYYHPRETERVVVAPVITLTEIYQITGPIDYLKIDTEGGEFDILVPKLAIQLVLENVGYLHLENHGFDTFDYYCDRKLLHAYFRESEKPGLVLNESLDEFFDLKVYDECPERQRLMGYKR